MYTLNKIPPVWTRKSDLNIHYLVGSFRIKLKIDMRRKVHHGSQTPGEPEEDQALTAMYPHMQATVDEIAMFHQQPKVWQL
jgi:hypothetical protein